MTAPTPDRPICLTLIRSTPPCRKCREAEAALDAVAREHGPNVAIAVLTLAEAQAAGHGVVLTPTVLLNGKVLCAGIVPLAAGVARLVAAELQSP